MVRKWQDRALQTRDEASHACGHYKSFITWPFQRENTPLGRVKDWGARPDELGAEFPGDGRRAARSSGEEPRRGLPRPRTGGRRVRPARPHVPAPPTYLRTQSLARLFLDNIYSIGASWVTMGPHIGQVALAYGANDMGSVMMEENVVSSAGTTYCLDEAVLCRLIRDAGFIPAQRNNTYDIVKMHPAGSAAPDLRVSDWSTHRARRLHVETKKEEVGVALTMSAGSNDSK